MKITKVLRHSTDDVYYPKGAASSFLYGKQKDSSENEVEEGGKFNENDIVKFAMPRHCNPHHGPGEFVFMGKKRLGDLTMVCVSSLSDWAEMVRTMNSDGTSHCVLKS